MAPPARRAAAGNPAPPPARRAAAGNRPQPPKTRRNVFSGGSASRSAYFARREAAKVLRDVLRGDACRRAVGTIKSLVYAPSVRNKKATFALVCQTLKYLTVLKDVLAAVGALTGKWKRQQELMYVTTYDILFGHKSVSMDGDAEKFLLHKENALQTALAKVCVKEKVKCPEDLLKRQTSVVLSPRYVRVNTLKMDTESAIRELEEAYAVKKDAMVPDLLVLPAGSDLHDHPLVMNGSIFLQGKASSMPAFALNPEPGWKVLDACAAPGNKTVQLAAIMKGKGKIIACELNEKRIKHLQNTVNRSGALNIDVHHGDFLNLNLADPLFSQVQAILLDPSCSGSGTTAERLDHLLPSKNEGIDAEITNNLRIRNLASFQSKVLAHALSFPAVERVVYSTCSIHQMENEDVINSVLPLASSLNFKLVAPFPQWPRRGLPVFEGSDCLLRTDPADGMEGFFIALFVRQHEDHPCGLKRCSSVHECEVPDKPSCGIYSKKKLPSRKRRDICFHPCKMPFLLHLQLVGKNKMKRKKRI